MATSDTPDRPRSVTLSLSSEATWTLHHVLLDRIEQEAAEATPVSVEPPPIEVFQAFERLDAGNTSFTIAQLEAIQTVLVEYHHASTWWELERAGIERLLHRVTRCLNQQHAPCSAD
jgi:hypothetical protein